MLNDEVGSTFLPKDVVVEGHVVDLVQCLSFCSLLDSTRTERPEDTSALVTVVLVGSLSNEIMCR